MKIKVLRGGAPVHRRRGSGDGTADRGVMAIGSADAWLLVNMSPAVAHQLDTDTRLPAALADAVLRTVVLTAAQIDHVSGLLSLRNGPPIDLYTTPAVFEALTSALPILPVLQHYCPVHWHPIPVAGDTRVASFRISTIPRLEFTAIDIPMPPLPHVLAEENVGAGNAIALKVRDSGSGQSVFFAPGAASLGAQEFDWMRNADCLMFDAPAALTASRREAAPRWLDRVPALPARHKVLLSPFPEGEEPRALAQSGIAIAYDGLEIEL